MLLAQVRLHINLHCLQYLDYLGSQAQFLVQVPKVMHVGEGGCFGSVKISIG